MVENYEPNVQVVEAAKSAGAQRFVFVGASSEAERGFAGPNPGLYTAKRAAALAALDAFGDGFTYIGPHLVVESKDAFAMKALNSGLANGLRALNDVIGDIRSFGPDYTTKTKLTPPVLLSDLALAIASCAIGKVQVDQTVRRAGQTVFSETRESDQYTIEDEMRHVDGTTAITALARRAEATGLAAEASSRGGRIIALRSRSRLLSSSPAEA